MFAKELPKSTPSIKDNEMNDVEEPDKRVEQVDGKLILAEEKAYGHVSWDACKRVMLPLSFGL